MKKRNSLHKLVILYPKWTTSKMPMGTRVYLNKEEAECPKLITYKLKPLNAHLGRAMLALVIS